MKTGLIVSLGGALILCLPAARSSAGPVTLLSADLRADVSQDLVTIGGGPTDHKEGHDTGSLSDPKVSASATAALPFGGIDYGASRGNANATLNLAATTTLHLDGEVDSTVF